MHCRRKLKLIPVDSEHLEPATQKKEPGKYHKAWQAVCEADGVVVPGSVSPNQVRKVGFYRNVLSRV
jgi:hypothetical protein